MATKPLHDWSKLGQKLAQKLDGITDEAKIKKLVINTVNQITEARVNPRRPLDTIRKEIRAKFPTVPATEAKPEGYYYTDSSKGRVKRFEHLALWYLTENTERWSVTGDDARKEYWQGLPKFGEPSTPPSEKKEISKKPIVLTTEFLESAVIDGLELDEDTSEILKLALAHSGLDLAEFMQRAIKTYANTITGKIRRLEERLMPSKSTIPKWQPSLSSDGLLLKVYSQN